MLVLAMIVLRSDRGASGLLGAQHAHCHARGLPILQLQQVPQNGANRAGYVGFMIEPPLHDADEYIDMQRFQVPYTLKEIPEVQAYLADAFERSKHHGDLQDLYRRSLLVEPKQSADQPPTTATSTLFHWSSRSQTPSVAS